MLMNPLLPVPRQILTIVEAMPESAQLLLRPELLNGCIAASKTLRGKVQNHHSESARVVIYHVEKAASGYCKEPRLWLCPRPDDQPRFYTHRRPLVP